MTAGSKLNDSAHFTRKSELRTLRSATPMPFKEDLCGSYKFPFPGVRLVKLLKC